jgi:outer membrane biosynthesis protein TonB
MNLKYIQLLVACIAITACTTPSPNNNAPVADMKSAVPFSSPECLAAKLPPGEPFPASAIPEAALSKKQSGWVAIRYDVIDGSAQNLAVVGSSPTGLYDTAAMQHAAKYKVSGKAPVRGCVTTIEVKF